jgi:hypothetical protein
LLLVHIMTLTWLREDDTKWPQKNKDGRQELEIRLGSEHISFEVRVGHMHTARQNLM